MPGADHLWISLPWGETRNWQCTSPPFRRRWRGKWTVLSRTGTPSTPKRTHDKPDKGMFKQGQNRKCRDLPNRARLAKPGMVPGPLDLAIYFPPTCTQDPNNRFRRGELCHYKQLFLSRQLSNSYLPDFLIFLFEEKKLAISSNRDIDLAYLRFSRRLIDLDLDMLVKMLAIERPVSIQGSTQMESHDSSEASYEASL